MATTRLSTAARSAAANAIVDLIDAGSSAGTIEIRTGSLPATPNTAASGTLLGTLTFTDPAFGNASSGVATAASITSDTSADATGTAGYFRVLDSNGNAVFDGDITATGGGGALELTSTAIVSGGTIEITALTLTQPL